MCLFWRQIAFAALAEALAGVEEVLRVQPRLDALGQFHLVFGAEQGGLADSVETREPGRQLGSGRPSRCRFRMVKFAMIASRSASNVSSDQRPIGAESSRGSANSHPLTWAKATEI